MRRAWVWLLLAGCGGFAPGLGGVSQVPTSTCASGQRWTGGTRESALMQPGVACIACHSTGEGPRFLVAGTVYRDYDEKDQCGGGTQGLTVVITEANGTVSNLTVNSMGNFYLERRSALSTPFKARVVDAMGSVREMAAMQTVGDCNSCHTETGAQSAPGRIIAP